MKRLIILSVFLLFLGFGTSYSQTNLRVMKAPQVQNPYTNSSEMINFSTFMDGQVRSGSVIINRSQINQVQQPLIIYSHPEQQQSDIVIMQQPSQRQSNINPQSAWEAADNYKRQLERQQEEVRRRLADYMNGGGN